MGKIKYEKPTCLDAGKIAAIQGAMCQTYGNFAADGCANGHDPAFTTICLPLGAGATNDCQVGNSAQGTCQAGNTPGWSQSCLAGLSAALCASGNGARFVWD